MNLNTKINNVQAKAVVTLTTAISELMRKKDGLTTVEYAVAGALIAAAVVVAFGALGDQVGVVITDITAAITPAAAPAAP